MTTPTPAQRRESKAKQRRLQKEREPPAARAATRASLGTGAGRLGLRRLWRSRSSGQRRSLGKLLGKIFGVLFPAVGGCRTPDELTRVRAWDKNLPTTLLGACPSRSGAAVAAPRPRPLDRRWRQVQDNSPATRRRGRGRGRAMTKRLDEVRPAAGPSGHLVERPGTSRPARDRWATV